MSAAFHEVRFPTDISRGSTGGPQRRTEIVVLGSGHEERNSRWADSRRRYEAGLGLRTLDDIHAVVMFFEERRGRLHGFRWKDHADFKSCAPSEIPAPMDQVIGAGDGQASQFQLQKTYGAGEAAYSRDIRKPVPGSVQVAVDAVALTPTTGFTVDETTGLVTLAGSAPAAGAVITAGFEFDVPARFDSDQLENNLAAFEAGQIPDIPIVEIAI